MGSVLGRIGVSWLIAALLYMRFRPRILLVVSILIPIVYWMLIFFVPAPDALTAIDGVPEKYREIVASFGTGPYSIAGNLSGWVERRFIPGVLQPYGILDNQSVLGYLPAVSTALFGILTGDFVRRTRGRLSDGRRLSVLFVAAGLLVGFGLVIAFGFGEMSMPINKKLWSASFTFLVGGYSVAVFALFHWIVDILGFTKWTFFFRVIGMNSITIYMTTAIVPVMLISERIFGGVAKALPDAWGAVVIPFGYIVLCWLYLYFLYRKNTFLKI